MLTLFSFSERQKKTQKQDNTCLCYSDRKKPVPASITSWTIRKDSGQSEPFIMVAAFVVMALEKCVGAWWRRVHSFKGRQSFTGRNNVCNEIPWIWLWGIRIWRRSLPPVLPEVCISQITTATKLMAVLGFPRGISYGPSQQSCPRLSEPNLWE